MTACIDPGKGRIKVNRAAPEVRLQDYLEGLQFWVGLQDPRINKIVFVENSGYPLAALQRAVPNLNGAGKEVEFLSMNNNDYPEGAHYGYAELGMIDHALSTSKLLARSTHFIKATGRLTFPSIGRLLDRLPDPCAFAVDCRNSTLLRRRPQVFVSTQLMLFSRTFYTETLCGVNSQLGGKHYHIETLLYSELVPFHGQPQAVLRWPVNVSPRGVAAHWQKNYHSPAQRTINMARAFCRLAFPHWWI